MDALASAEITPGEGIALAGMYNSMRQAFERNQLAERLAEIERRLGDAK